MAREQTFYWHVRFGSKADMCSAKRHVRFTPKSGHVLYLYRDGQETDFRIHGTNEPDSIGKAVSSGCIRMLNQDVIDSIYACANWRPGIYCSNPRKSVADNAKADMRSI